METNPRVTFAPDEELQLTSSQVRAVLEARAARLARAYEHALESEARHLQTIAFHRGSHRYGVPLEHLTEIRPLESWTPVPGVPPVFVGVIQLRGEILAVMDLAVLFGAGAAEPPAEPYAIVLSVGDVTAALLADSVDDVYDIPPERIYPPLATFTAARERYITGLSDDSIAIVDVEKLLHDEWLRVSHETHEDRR